MRKGKSEGKRKRREKKEKRNEKKRSGKKMLHAGNLLDGIRGGLSGGVGNEAEALGEALGGIDHETQVPNHSTLLKEWNQSVLEDVFRDLATEDLEGGEGGRKG